MQLHAEPVCNLEGSHQGHHLTFTERILVPCICLLTYLQSLQWPCCSDAVDCRAQRCIPRIVACVCLQVIPLLLFEEAKALLKRGFGEHPEHSTAKSK